MSDTTIPATKPIAKRGYTHPEVLVSTGWVAEHRDDPKVRILESNEDLLLYDTGHIPGAIKIDWLNDLNDPVVRDYIGRDQFEAVLRSKGINSIRGTFGKAGLEQEKALRCMRMFAEEVMPNFAEAGVPAPSRE